MLATRWLIEISVPRGACLLVSYRPLGVYPPTKPTYADAHAGATSEVRMEGYEFGHTYVWQGPVYTTHSQPVVELRNRDKEKTKFEA